MKEKEGSLFSYWPLLVALAALGMGIHDLSIAMQQGWTAPIHLSRGGTVPAWLMVGLLLFIALGFGFWFVLLLLERREG